ncbi:hypothetical protein BBP40_003174 [Aspergillus hancockii]|nr:hypothetical protein BBP40_003174 [Aspergillus hancockii]
MEDILDGHHEKPLPGISPDLAEAELGIFGEDISEHIMTRSIVPQVNESVKRALESLWPDELEVMISTTRGGRARKSRSLTDHTFKALKFPDWAAAQKASQGYLNLCPGETILSTKWRSQLKGEKSWFWTLF